MPVYNAGEYLRMAVLSIVNQTYTNWELLLIDDGSTDGAIQNISDINDSRIQVLHDGKNKGLAARLNECIDLARGKYFARMDQDDISYPERFAQQIEVLEKDSMLDLVSVRSVMINENNKLVGLFPSALTHDEIGNRPWQGFYFPHPTWMGKIEWFRKYRYYEPGPYLCEDQELLLRSYSKSTFATIDNILFAYRVRNKVELRKLAKNRWSVLNVQLHHFIKMKLWFFVLLSMVTFSARIINDFTKKIRVDIFNHRKEIDDRAVISNWNNILKNLVSVSKVQ